MCTEKECTIKELKHQLLNGLFFIKTIFEKKFCREFQNCAKKFKFSTGQPTTSTTREICFHFFVRNKIIETGVKNQ